MSNIKTNEYEEKVDEIVDVDPKGSSLIIDHISHSSLNALSVSPLYFRKYKDNELEEYKSKSLDIGSAVHCYVLRADDFKREYFSSDLVPPGGMMGTFIETLAALKKNDFWEDITSDDLPEQEAYELAYEAAGFKTKIETVIKNFEKIENQEYYNSLQTHYGMVHLSPKELETVVACNNSIMYHRITNDLLVGTPLDNRIWLSEVEVNFSTEGTVFELEHKSFNIKSIIDKVVIDKDTKTVYVIDLKTTGSSVYNFESSYRKYKYYRQLALYRQAMGILLKKFGINVAEYTIKCYIVAVQTTGLHECVIYRPAEKDLKMGEKEIDSLIERLVWHCDRNSWDYPREYYSGNPVVEICISDDKTTPEEEEHPQEGESE